MANYKNNFIPKHVLGNSNILPQSRANQSQFNLSEDLKTSIGFDYLYPVYIEELNPADKFEIKVKTLARLMPMVAPTMSNIQLKYFAFFVPNRLLWKNWTKFMGEKIYQDDTNEYTLPVVSCTEGNVFCGSIADYMGFPLMGKEVDPARTYKASALPFRAYNKIWNEWFRANELQAPIKEVSDDNTDESGLNVETDMYLLRKKGKPLDYFTSCLPYPQSGEPVMIPLTGDAPVRAFPDMETKLNVSVGAPVTNIVPAYLGGLGVDGEKIAVDYLPELEGQKYDTNLFADMSRVTGVSIEMLRKASALQTLLEKDARAGESYIDLINAHYATTVPDFLVGRSQFLGSSSVMLNVEPIAQTGGTQSNSPQGNLAGVGIGVGGGDTLCEVSAVEHGQLVILACATGEVSYSQGLPRKFSKVSRYDYMFPEFHNLGDQAVLNKEIYLSGNDKLDNEVFGYQERYRELRESTNKVTGLMRSDVENSLDVWHLGEKFNNTPTLSGQFIESNTPIDRVMAVPTEDKIILNSYFDVKATRTLPVSSNPSLLAGRV